MQVFKAVLHEVGPLHAREEKLFLFAREFLLHRDEERVMLTYSSHSDAADSRAAQWTGLFVLGICRGCNTKQSKC